MAQLKLPIARDEQIVSKVTVVQITHSKLLLGVLTGTLISWAARQASVTVVS